MKTNILTTIAFTILLASCSTAYKQGQTPDDVYYSPAKEKTLAKADNNRNNDRYAGRNNDDYQDNITSSEDQYLRMKIQNRYRWNTIDDYDYWSSPSYAFSNYYGYNSFNPLAFNSWGMNYYYSPFASIQPYGWFNSYYPTYGYYGGYSGYYGHGYGYGYSPVYVVNPTPRYNVHRPMLGGYVKMVPAAIATITAQAAAAAIFRPTTRQAGITIIATVRPVIAATITIYLTAAPIPTQIPVQRLQEALHLPHQAAPVVALRGSRAGKLPNVSALHH